MRCAVISTRGGAVVRQGGFEVGRWGGGEATGGRIIIGYSIVIPLDRFPKYVKLTSNIGRIAWPPPLAIRYNCTAELQLCNRCTSRESGITHTHRQISRVSNILLNIGLEQNEFSEQWLSAVDFSGCHFNVKLRFFFWQFWQMHCDWECGENDLCGVLHSDPTFQTWQTKYIFHRYNSGECY